MDCGQVCQYHTLYGCKAEAYGVFCPLAEKMVETAKRRTGSDAAENLGAVACNEKQATSDKTSDENKRFATDNSVGDKGSPTEPLTNGHRWIPVTERLPEPFVSVLVYMPEERPLTTVHEGYVASDGSWYAHFFVREVHEVTHWMPLPEPPKEE